MALELYAADISEAVPAGFFLAGESRRHEVEGILQGSFVDPIITRFTHGKDTFLSEISPDELDRLRLVILDLGGQADPVALAREVVDRLNPSAAVIALGDRNDVAFFRKLRQIGIADYLVHPTPSHILLHSVEYLYGRGRRGAGGTIIAFYGTHGGVGAGLLAAGAGTHMAGIHGRRTLLGDTDFANPSVGSHLGLDRQGDLALALETGDRLDDALLQQAARQVFDNLSLLNAFDPMREVRPQENENARHLLDIVRRQYRYLVWRVSGNSPLSRAVLMEADRIYLVSTGSLASAAAAQGMQDWLRRHNSRAPIVQIFNTVSPKQPLEPRMVGQVTGQMSRIVVPFKKNLGRDLAINVSLKDSSHSLYREFYSLAAEILGVRQEKVSKLRRRFGL